MRILLIAVLLSIPRAALPFPVWADYDAELREAAPRADGNTHVDTPALMARLKQLHVTTYAFLLYHSPADFDDLATEFLPAADRAGIEVWAYLVPPTEAPMSYPPCGKDYVCWAQKLQALAQAHPALTAMVMDDFDGNTGTFTPAYMQKVRAAAPSVKFHAIDYYPQVLTDLLNQDYQGVIDGIIFPYRDLDATTDLPGQLAAVCDVVKNRITATGLTVPPNTPSQAGDFLALTRTATVLGGGAHRIAFTLRDTYGGPTAGYHQFQLLVDGQVVYRRDAAMGGLPEPVDVDVAAQVAGKPTVPVTLRIYDLKGVSNYPVTFAVSDLSTPGLDPGIGEWTVTRMNAATWTQGTWTRDYHGRCVLMVYAASTSWHMAPPATAYITAALTIGQKATAAGSADGVITYALNKQAGSPDFDEVARLYAAWSAPQDLGAAPSDGAVSVADGGMSAPAGGCGCMVGGAARPAGVLVLLLAGLALAWRGMARRK